MRRIDFEALRSKPRDRPWWTLNSKRLRLFEPLLVVAEAAERMGHGHPSFHVNDCSVCEALATFAEAVERET